MLVETEADSMSKRKEQVFTECILCSRDFVRHFSCHIVCDIYDLIIINKVDELLNRKEKKTYKLTREKMDRLVYYFGNEKGKK